MTNEKKQKPVIIFIVFILITILISCNDKTETDDNASSNNLENPDTEENLSPEEQLAIDISYEIVCKILSDEELRQDESKWMQAISEILEKYDMTLNEWENFALTYPGFNEIIEEKVMSRLRSSEEYGDLVQNIIIDDL